MIGMDILIACAAFAGGMMLLHVVLSLKKSPIPGLIMPILFFVASVALAVFMQSNTTEPVSFLQMAKVFFMMNIPTLVALVLYWFARRMVTRPHRWEKGKKLENAAEK